MKIFSKLVYLIISFSLSLVFPRDHVNMNKSLSEYFDLNNVYETEITSKEIDQFSVINILESLDASPFKSRLLF